jgi:mannose-6-phosphate isomerase-like protein (cupin superfamily)
MQVQRRDDAPRNERGGQVSHLLFAPQLGSTNLAITWVRGEPGSQQGLHAHEDSEQVYVIVRGRGLMIVDNEEREVEAGQAILIPAGAEHAIRNTGSEPLEYVSATTPPFPADIADDTWRPRHTRKAADGSGAG